MTFVYRLLARLGRGAGPWIGAPVELSAQPSDIPATDPPAALSPPARAAFGRPEPLGAPEFLSLREGHFEERDAAGRVLARARLGYVLRRPSDSTPIVMAFVSKTTNPLAHMWQPQTSASQ